MNQQIVEAVIALSYQASEEIVSVYHDQQGGQVHLKADHSPVTAADLASHQVLSAGLPGLLKDVPLLSEEAEIPDFEERTHWQRYWLIDPLDGTKEFVRRNGEFTVNIALIEQGVPIFGVVTVPLTGECYWGLQGHGAFKRVDGIDYPIATRAQQADRLDWVASRLHGTEALQLVEETLSQHFSDVGQQSMGSSLKLCLVAEGKADIYPRFAPTSEWDTAAAQAVVEAAGGVVTDLSLQPLMYNTKDSVLNPWFYVLGDADYPWQKILGPIASRLS